MSGRYDPDRHHRRSVRLQGYDYAQAGAYFVTICTAHRECLFGEVVDGEMSLNPSGRIADEEWRRTAEVRADVELDAFVIMPNHIHGILLLRGPAIAKDADHRRGTAPTCPGGARFGQPIPGSLSTIIGLYKSAVTKRINILRDAQGVLVRQRGLHERILRDAYELEHACAYISNNPTLWAEDQENPLNVTLAERRRGA